MSQAGGGQQSGGFLWPPFSDPRAVKATQVDQGVDYVNPGNYVAVGNGTVVHIDPNFYNGTPAVYVKLDTPVSVNGRTYDAVYYSETRALVSTGQRVTAGKTAISGPGAGELGFARRFGSSWLPAAHGLYDGHTPTQAGDDFAAAVQSAVFTSGGGADQTPGTTTTVSGPGGTVTSSGPGGGLFGLLNLLSELTSAAFWLRALEVVGGGVLLLVGLYLLARNVGLAAPPPPGPAGDIADTFKEPPGIDAHRAVHSREGVKRKTKLVGGDEAGERRAEIRRRSAAAEPSDEIPF